MNKQSFIKSGELAGMFGAMSYMVIRYTPEKSLVQEAICTIPVVILGGIIGKGISELMTTPIGIFITSTFSIGLICLSFKYYCIPALLNEPQGISSNVTSQEVSDNVRSQKKYLITLDFKKYLIPLKVKE